MRCKRLLVVELREEQRKNKVVTTVTYVGSHAGRLRNRKNSKKTRQVYVWGHHHCNENSKGGEEVKGWTGSESADQVLTSNGSCRRRVARRKTSRVQQLLNSDFRYLRNRQFSLSAVLSRHDIADRRPRRRSALLLLLLMLLLLKIRIVTISRGLHRRQRRRVVQREVSNSRQMKIVVTKRSQTRRMRRSRERRMIWRRRERIVRERRRRWRRRVGRIRSRALDSVVVVVVVVRMRSRHRMRLGDGVGGQRRRPTRLWEVRVVTGESRTRWARRRRRHQVVIVSLDLRGSGSQQIDVHTARRASVHAIAIRTEMRRHMRVVVRVWRRNVGRGNL